MMKLSCVTSGDKKRVGTLVLDRQKYVTGTSLYPGWRYWAITNVGGMELDKAINEITGNNLHADWYGKSGEEHVRQHTKTPSAEMVTFCGSITNTTLSYDIEYDLGIVGLYAQVTPENEEIIKAEVEDLKYKIVEKLSLY